MTTTALINPFKATGGGSTPANTGFVFAGAGANVPDAGTVVWTNPGNILASDNVKAAAGLSTNIAITEMLYASQFDFSSIPDTATPTLFTVRIEKQRQQADSQTRDHTIQFTFDGTTLEGSNKADTGTDWPTSDTNTNHVFTPAEAGNPTVAQIKASTFGVMIKAQQLNNPALGNNARVDAVAVDVSYLS